MRDENKRNIFIILKDEIVLFFKSLFSGIVTSIKDGPFFIIYLLSSVAVFIDDTLKNIIETIRYYRKKLISSIIKMIDNSKILRNYRQRQEKKLRVLTVDKLNRKRNKKKIIYEYLVRIPGRDLKKGYYSAYSEVDVYSYLIKNGYVVYSIKTGKWISFKSKNLNYLNNTVEEDDMLKWLAHLCVVLKKGVSTRDAFMTIAKNNKNKKYKQLLDNIIKELIKGEKLSSALSKQGNSFPDDLISLIRNAEYNDRVADALNEYLEDKYKEREKIVAGSNEPSNASILFLLFLIGAVIYIVVKNIMVKNNINVNLNVDTTSFNQTFLSILDFIKEHYYILAIIVFIILVMI